MLNTVIPKMLHTRPGFLVDTTVKTCIQLHPAFLERFTLYVAGYLLDRRGYDQCEYMNAIGPGFDVHNIKILAASSYMGNTVPLLSRRHSATALPSCVQVWI
jgi:hypothetical protein